MIKSMPTSSPNTVDRLVWPTMKSSSYIVKLGYHATIYCSQCHHCDEANNFHVVFDVIWKIIWGARHFVFRSFKRLSVGLFSYGVLFGYIFPAFIGLFCFCVTLFWLGGVALPCFGAVLALFLSFFFAF